MNKLKTLFLKDYYKALDVVNSITSLNQLDSASRYIMFFYIKHIDGKKISREDLSFMKLRYHCLKDLYQEKKYILKYQTEKIHQ